MNQPHQNAYNELLYLKTSENIQYQTNIFFRQFHLTSKLTLKNVLKQILYVYQKDFHTQQLLAREMIHMNHLIPLYISPSIVLSPLQSRRAPIQYYINMSHVIGLTSHKNSTFIHFKNNHTLNVPISFTICLKKWKDAHLLSSLLSPNPFI